ncbi:TonB-dependent receptor domain-containing protein [Sphingomonas sp. C3-2]|uniref:TonB-dependent receptor domain-containing protein n=1 Tax=Sphingomonas sp. C3-2 TaxID=3062169 RepID=UPI00294AA4E7|nr:TonB-dependent receptor [Sphingomonas sp. C3-2]WOK36435.1 outer membrane beta-barrel protein [Sphingomonas sp. C3-2]
MLKASAHRWRYGALAFGLLIPGQLLAQSNTPVLQDFRDQNIRFKRDGLVSVLDRPQPLYDPVPYRIGSVEVMPRISADATYNSNIYAIDDATDDLIFRVRPQLSANTVAGDFALSGAAALDHREYLDNGNQSSTDFTLGFNARYEPGRDTQVYIGTRSGRETQDRADPDFPFNLQQAIQFDFASAYVGASHSFNRLRIAGRLGAEKRDYEDGRDALGAVIDQDFRNRTLYTADLAAEYGISPKTSAYINLSLNKRDFPAPVIGGKERDSKGFEITAGTSFELSKLIRGEVGLGYFKQDFKSNEFRAAKGLAANARLEYLMTPLVTWTLTAGRSVQESSTLGTGVYVATTAGLRADYELRRNLIVSAGINYEHDKFEDIDRKYGIWGGSASATYKLSPRYALRAQYDYRDQSTSGAVPGREFARHRLMLGITVQGM